MNLENIYKSVRIRSRTYKEMKLLAIELNLPFTRLIDKIFKFYKQHHCYSLSHTRKGK